jgi:hypothetical protein
MYSTENEVSRLVRLRKPGRFFCKKQAKSGRFLRLAGVKKEKKA